MYVLFCGLIKNIVAFRKNEKETFFI